ncbi:MAG: hypothetical protein QG635_1867 [Bacteroidota bacterium]|nr:hypothetical protein [Bacteroidota bacterium]
MFITKKIINLTIVCILFFITIDMQLFTKIEVNNKKYHVDSISYQIEFSLFNKTQETYYIPISYWAITRAPYKLLFNYYMNINTQNNLIAFFFKDYDSLNILNREAACGDYYKLTIMFPLFIKLEPNDTINIKLRKNKFKKGRLTKLKRDYIAYENSNYYLKGKYKTFISFGYFSSDSIPIEFKSKIEKYSINKKNLDILFDNRFIGKSRINIYKESKEKLTKKEHDILRKLLENRIIIYIDEDNTDNQQYPKVMKK